LTHPHLLNEPEQARPNWMIDVPVKRSLIAHEH